MNRIAIFYPCDPIGFVPSGIDTFVRGILKWAPPDLDYTLFGATTDIKARPLGQEIRIAGLRHECGFVPLVTVDLSARRTRIPLTLRYMWALRRRLQRESNAEFEVLDFHRLEPIALFRADPRPKNLMLHQDMSVIRDKSSDIKWRYAPWLYERLETHLFRHVEHVFCVRQSAVERYRHRYADGKPEFEFIPTWVDVEAFSITPDARDATRQRVRTELGLPAESRLLIFVGRLDRQKDPLLLVDAFNRAVTHQSGLHLMVVGDGALRSQVEQRIRSGGLSGKVSLMGAQPPARIVSLLQASDLFVLSSAYEGMPIAVLEALAAGIPVVSTDVGEIRLVVREGVNGSICKSPTAESIATGILSVLARLDSLRGSACMEAAREFGPEAVLNRIYQHHRRQAGRLGRERVT